MKAVTSDSILLTRILQFSTGKSMCRGASVKDFPIPTPSETEILVKVHAVSLNPIDYRYIDFLSPKNSRIGCDYSGTITQVGSSAKGNWKIGDRVAGMVHGGPFIDEGSFAEYVKIDGDLAWKVPEEIEHEVAATYGISATTAVMALNEHLGLPWLDSNKKSDLLANGEKPSILIYSAASSVGLFAIQIAKAAGYTVVATASPRSTQLVKSYGADFVFDYHSPTAAAEIANQHPTITKALDCFSVGKSTEFCASAMKGDEGTVVTLIDTGKKSKRAGSNVQFDSINVFTSFGVEFAWLPPVGPRYPKSSRDREALARFYEMLPRVIVGLKAPPIEVVEKGGFEGIFEGLDRIRKGEVVGKKLVVRM